MTLAQTNDYSSSSRCEVSGAGRNSSLAGHENIVLPDFNDVLIALYDGPLQPIPSWDPFLQEMRKYFSANQAVLIFRVPVKSGFNIRIIIGGERPLHEYEKFYCDSFYALDPLANLHKDQVSTVDDFLGKEKWTESDFYKNFLRPMDVFHVLAADMKTNDGIDCRIRISRPESMPNFDHVDKLGLHFMIPHLKRCVQIHSSMHEIFSTNQLLGSTIDRLMFGSITLDQKGAVLHANSIAEDFLQSRSELIYAHGLLRAAARDEDKILQKLITEALKDREENRPVIAKGMTIKNEQTGDAMSIVVRALPAGCLAEGERHPSVAILIRDPKLASSPTAASLRRLYSLTVAESELATLLTEGITLDQAAERLNVSRNTARTQLRSLFWKTGTSRQADFIRTVTGSVAPLFDS